MASIASSSAFARLTAADSCSTAPARAVVLSSKSLCSRKFCAGAMSCMHRTAIVCVCKLAAMFTYAFYQFLWRLAMVSHQQVITYS